MKQNTAAGQSHPWLWTLLKGELPCRSTQLQAVAKLNRSSTCCHFISARITVQIKQCEENIPPFGRAETGRQGLPPHASQWFGTGGRRTWYTEEVTTMWNQSWTRNYPIFGQVCQGVAPHLHFFAIYNKYTIHWKGSKFWGTSDEVMMEVSPRDGQCCPSAAECWCTDPPQTCPIEAF